MFHQVVQPLLPYISPRPEGKLNERKVRKQDISLVEDI
jgi:hypothetical protein